MYWYDDTSDRDPSSRRCVDFIIDTPADINNLPGIGVYGKPQPDDSTVHFPVEKGSTAMSISPAKLFILNSSNQWTEAK